MKEISLEEIKKIELGILVYIDEVCRENSLRYSLCGGTLLGAVRHKGFIPWDDDIDIMMPRPDYEKLIDILECKTGRYKIISPRQEDSYYNFSKVIDTETTLNEHNCQPITDMGVYVDIFPIEGLPADETDRTKHFDKLCRLRKRINEFYLTKPAIRKNLFAYAKTMFLYCRNIGKKPIKFQKEYERLAKQYSYDESEYVYMSGGAYAKKELFPRVFVESFETRVFENGEFSATKEYDLYLKQLYGDYMKLPPKEKQVTHHHFTAKYKDSLEGAK